jgi:hypothetical protein
MVKAHFDATSVTPINSAPEHSPINILEDEIVKVAATFKTNQYRGNTGCLALVAGEG